MALNNDITTDFPLEGVESEHCALVVDKELRKVSVNTSHKVELHNKRAIITSKDELETVPKAVKAIPHLNGNVDPVKKSFPVLNMTCASCASSSQSILENQPAVISVAVNYANATALVEFMPTITGPEKLKAALQSIGYDLMIDESEEARDALVDLDKKMFQKLRNKTFGTIVLSIPIVAIGMFFMNIPYANYIMWALATPSLLYNNKG